MTLLVLSNDRLSRGINWSTLGPPLLGALASTPDSRLVAPPPLRSSEAGEWLRSLRLSRGTDAVFWMQGSSRPELPLSVLSAACGRTRRSAFVVDAWRPALTKIGVLAVTQQLDPCFVGFLEGQRELAARFPRGRFVWLPFGVDTQVFKYRSGPRDVFAYWMGRRYEPLHQALVRYCSDRGLTYLYTTRSGQFQDPQDLGRMVSRCRYFVVTPPDLDNPARTGGFSPLVMRYLEGLAAGSRLLGVLPRSGEYEALLPMEAILQVAPDGSDLEEKLDGDSWEHWQPHLATIAGQVAVEHSWAARADRIRGDLGLAGASGSP